MFTGVILINYSNTNSAWKVFICAGNLSSFLKKILTLNFGQNRKSIGPVDIEKRVTLSAPKNGFLRLTSSVDMLKNRSEDQSEFGCVKMLTEKIFQRFKNSIRKNVVTYFSGPPTDWFLRLIFSTSISVKLREFSDK